MSAISLFRANGQEYLRSRACVGVADWEWTGRVGAAVVRWWINAA